MRIGVVGRGPAGLLAALIAHRAGARAFIVAGDADAPQSDHCHILRGGLADRIAGVLPALAQDLRDRTTPDHSWITATGVRHVGPRLTRAGLMTALETGLARACIQITQGRAEAVDPMDADLWIDATGGTRALSRAVEARGGGLLRLDDIGPQTRWKTEIWHRALDGAPFTQIFPGRLYLEAGPDMTMTTGPDTPVGDLQLHRPLPPGAPDHTLSMICPPARMATWIGTDGLPPLVLFGDARLQTSPSMGFGIMGVAQQAEILWAALQDCADPDAGLTDWAEGVWAGAAMQAALSA